jgi:four helix bundle protein
MIKSYKDLDVFQRSKKLYPELVKYTKEFPREAWHLRDQLCRSGNSTTGNIAEGYGRSVAEFKQYLTRSLGSCNETVSHLGDSIAANFGDKNKGLHLIQEYEIVGKQLYRLRQNWK